MPPQTVMVEERRLAIIVTADKSVAAPGPEGTMTIVGQMRRTDDSRCHNLARQNLATLPPLRSKEGVLGEQRGSF